MRRVIAAAALIAAITTGGDAATARCAPREAILEAAFRQYGERPVAMALAAGGALLEVIATRDGAAFTMLQTSPGGTSCVIAAGEGWQILPWNPPAEKDNGS